MRHEEQYFNSRPQIVIYAIDISESLNLSQQKLLTGIAVWLREGSGWLVENINGHCIKSHFLRKSRIARHSSKNRIFYYFAKTSLLVT